MMGVVLGTVKYQTLANPEAWTHLASMTIGPCLKRRKQPPITVAASLEAMGRCVAAKGYAETTIADVVGEAAVSRG
jgi:hypothetical protein